MHPNWALTREEDACGSPKLAALRGAVACSKMSSSTFFIVIGGTFHRYASCVRFPATLLPVFRKQEHLSSYKIQAPVVGSVLKR